jgi:hypothetical protein
MSQSAEFLAALEQNLITEDHLLYEIGEVMAKPALGRTSNADVPIHKSLGSVIQPQVGFGDLAKRLNSPCSLINVRQLLDKRHICLDLNSLRTVLLQLSL